MFISEIGFIRESEQSERREKVREYTTQIKPTVENVNRHKENVLAV